MAEPPPIPEETQVTDDERLPSYEEMLALDVPESVARFLSDNPRPGEPTDDEVSMAMIDAAGLLTQIASDLGKRIAVQPGEITGTCLTIIETAHAQLIAAASLAAHECDDEAPARPAEHFVESLIDKAGAHLKVIADLYVMRGKQIIEARAKAEAP